MFILFCLLLLLVYCCCSLGFDAVGGGGGGGRGYYKELRNVQSYQQDLTTRSKLGGVLSEKGIFIIKSVIRSLILPREEDKVIS